MSDFKSRNYEIDESTLENNYLCPDIASDDDQYRIESSYSNRTFRQSFSVEIQACNLEINPTCKNMTEQLWFLETFYYTFYLLQSRVEFTKENLMEYPLRTESKFHS
jgi:hypothetical protein